MNFKNLEYVLVLATKPKTKPSILDWCPFDNVPLNQIIDKHNSDYLKFLSNIPWPANFIEESAPFLAIMNYDLSELERIELSRFPRIKFVFANLDELTAASTAIRQIAAFMNQARRVYCLVQITKHPPQASMLKSFTPSLVVPSDPEVIANQQGLEKWLNQAYTPYQNAISEAMPPSSGGPSKAGGEEPSGDRTHKSWTRVFADYRPYHLPTEGGQATIILDRSLQDIASEVRDTALLKGLDEKQTRLLTRKAVLQEKALVEVRASLSDHLGLRKGSKLIMDNLRKPLAEISLDDAYDPSKPTLDLVTVKLDQPLTSLPKRQSALFHGLGLHTNSHVVLRRETFQKNKALKAFVKGTAKVTLPFNAKDLLR